jgi:mitogen-activated protein kinase kinase 1
MAKRQGLSPLNVPPPPPRRVPDAEKVEVIAPIGSGTCATVNLVRFRGSYYACKVVPNCYLPPGDIEELGCWKELRHRNIVQYFSHSHPSNTLKIIMEFVDGRALADHYKKSTGVPEPVLGRIAWFCVQALGYLRKKHILHRDLKPSNILLSKTGEVKVCDFGVSALLDRSCGARASSIGTIGYMSPERLGARPYSFPADIWSLAFILYEGAAGHYPIQDPSVNMDVLRERLTTLLDFQLPGYSAGFVDFLRGCLEVDPERRSTVEQCAESWPADFKDSGQDELQEWITSHGFN